MYHPNKFYKILLKITNTGTTRLHIWKTKTKTETHNEEHIMNKQYPHTHGWNFKSFILKGSLTDVHYEKSIDNSDNNLVCYKDNIDSINEYGYVPQYDCKLKEINRFVHKEGTSYELNHDVIHLTIPESGSITLIHQEPYIQNKQNSIYNQSKIFLDLFPLLVLINLMNV